MRLVPETANRKDWPRLVAQVLNALSRKVEAQESGYVLFSIAGPLSVPAATWTTIDLTSPTVTVDQIPDDINGFVDTGTGEIVAGNRDAILTRFTGEVTPADATATEFVFGLDIAGIGINNQVSAPLVKGASVADVKTLTIPHAFFDSYELTPKVYSDGAVTVDDMVFLVQRTHKGVVG